MQTVHKLTAARVAGVGFDERSHRNAATKAKRFHGAIRMFYDDLYCVCTGLSTVYFAGARTGLVVFMYIMKQSRPRKKWVQ